MNAPGWDRIKEVFQEALDRPSHERGAWLHEICGEDRALQMEVESLLAKHAEAGSFAERPAIELLDQLSLEADSRVFAAVGRVVRPGDRLGGYDIQSLLGAGGMGEVYRARDLRLRRDVAIKVLPAAFVTDRERLARLEREARLLASLNHPYIGAIYGLEEVDGVRALVLELVEGETLADRIRRGPMSVAHALLIARQIAEALEAAHEKGIVHRDLKPANIKIAPGDTVKVLDFGLAKPGEHAPPDLSDSLPFTISGTDQGVLRGTVAYMSPEQARGQAVDKRSDIWAFGCVLYEMLVGRAAFSGQTISDHIVAILEREPDWSALPAALPPMMHRLLRRCLEKDPRRRLHDIADARIELEEIGAIGADSRDAHVGAAELSRIPQRMRAAWTATALLTALVVSLGIGIFYYRSRGPARQVRHLVLPLAANLDCCAAAIALSPDSTKVVFAGSRDGHYQLFVRALDQLVETPIPDTEGGFDPFFSPDGQWIGFFTGYPGTGKLKKIPIAGDTAVTVCECAKAPTGASWGSDDSIVFAATGASGLSRILASGGSPAIVTTLDSSQGEESHRFPQVLPGARAVLFTIGTGPGDDAQIVGQVLATGERRVLVRGSASARFAADGRLVYARGGTLFAMPFDPSRLLVSGSAVKLVDGVAEDSDGAPEYSLSTTGDLVYVPGPAGFDARSRRTFVWVDRKGAIEPIAAPPALYSTPSLSSDGQRIAFHIEAAKNDIWTYDFARATTTRMTYGHHHFPIWTPDGKHLTFASGGAGSMNLFWGPADGSGVEERLTTSKNQQLPESWSPDGRTLAFDERDPISGFDIWTVSLDGDRKPRPFLKTPYNEFRPRFSPDGRWLAYQSNETGRLEVYVRPFPGPGAKTKVSTNGGGGPRWGPDGRELFYRNRQEGMLVVPVAAGSSFGVGVPKRLFAWPFTGNMSTSGFEVAPDGRHLLMMREDPTPAPRQINVILDWFDARKAR
jgi:eukaryotic-like serine/threonine-protein kinase